MTAEACDFARNEGSGILPLADLSRNCTRDALLGRAVHERERLLHTLLRQQIEKRRLCQLNLQALFQRAIKDSVSSGIDEISDDDRVTLGQLRQAM